MFSVKFSAWAGIAVGVAALGGCGDGGTGSIGGGLEDVAVGEVPSGDAVAVAGDIGGGGVEPGNVAADGRAADTGSDWALGDDVSAGPEDGGFVDAAGAAEVGVGVGQAGDGAVEAPGDVWHGADVMETDAVSEDGAGTDEGDVAVGDVAPGDSAGCRGDDPSVWRDLGPSGFHGYLSDFDTAPVWAGSGAPGDPYRLEMPGSAWPRIELGGATALRLAEGTVEFWARADSATFANKMLYNHRNDAELAGVVVISQDGQWKALGSIENHGGRWSTVFAAPGHRLGVWQHVVLTWGQSHGQTRLVLHVDGVATGSGAMAGFPFYSTKGTAQIGGLNGGHGSFAGGIAVARIWSRALSEAEVKGLYATDAVPRFGREAPAETGVVPADVPLVHLDATPCQGL